MKAFAPLAILAAIVAVPTSVLAWGATGHRMIGEVAVRALPPELPGFLRDPRAAFDVGEYSREPDRSKGAGKTHDTDRDAGHFLDLSDDGTILGGPRLEALPLTREEYETQLRAAGQDSWKAGYLPYSIVDRWQQLKEDFAFWRILAAAEANPAWANHRAFFTADRRRREEQILIDVGALSHFVGDGSQPLHMTVHYNGWGDFPNPANYTRAHVHGPFESDLVQAAVHEADVAAALRPMQACDCAIEQQTAAYLAETGKLVVPFYELEKAGGLAPGDPRGPAFATRQIAVGASELRDMIVEAWRASDSQPIGYRPAITAAQVEAGQVDPFANLYGID
jgi:hypothetical protein